MYGVIEGEIELLVDSKVFETIHPGDIFGEGALVQIPSHQSVSCGGENRLSTSRSGQIPLSLSRSRDPPVCSRGDSQFVDPTPPCQG
jgi:hypothetical protein